VAFKLPAVGIPRLQAGPLVSFVSRRVESSPSQWPMSGGQPEAAAAGQAGPGSASGWQGSQWQGDGSLYYGSLGACGSCVLRTPMIGSSHGPLAHDGQLARAFKL
jgi:hypothetical protein